LRCGAALAIWSTTPKESAKPTAGRLTAASTLIAGLADAGKLKIAAAIYDLETGAVTYLE
jgi:carbonic anhydrase